jgi:hypothetical protein
MFEDHPVEAACVRRRPHQFREKRALLLGLMMVVCEGPQKAQDRFDIARIDRLVVLHASGHIRNNVKRTQNGFVVLNQHVYAFHQTLLPKL